MLPLVPKGRVMIPAETQEVSGPAEASSPVALGKSARLASSSTRRAAPAEDTVEGCEGRASADLILAATMDTENGRLRMERSARSWTARASLLEGEGAEAHLAMLRTEWADDEDTLPSPVVQPKQPQSSSGELP